MTNEELCIRIQEGNQEAMSTLWDSLYRFTYQQSYSFYTQYTNGCVNAGIVIDDLIQYAYIVMVKAVELYKPDTYRFITYYGKVLFRSYQRLISKSKFIDSLDKPIDSDDINSDTLIDITSDPDGEQAIDDVIETEYQRELRRDVQAALNLLSDTERNIIHERFWNCRTLKDLSEIHGITPQEARKTEYQALQRLRSREAMKYLNAYRQDIISMYAYNSSLSLWNYTHTSSTERTVIELEERGL